MTNAYNPYLAAQYAAYGYPYAMVGQDVSAAPMMPYPGPLPPFVPVGPVVPSLATNLPTHPVLGVVQAVDTPAVTLSPVLGVSGNCDLLSGFLSAKKKICGCSSGRVTLSSRLPFRIERLFIEGCDSRDFNIEQITIGQNVMTTGHRGFPAKYLGRGRGRGRHGRGCGFDINVSIDWQHPLRIWVKNKSNQTRKFKIFAEGQQLAR